MVVAGGGVRELEGCPGAFHRKLVLCRIHPIVVWSRVFHSGGQHAADGTKLAFVTLVTVLTSVCVREKKQDMH